MLSCNRTDKARKVQREGRRYAAKGRGHCSKDTSPAHGAPAPPGEPVGDPELLLKCRQTAFQLLFKWFHCRRRRKDNLNAVFFPHSRANDLTNIWVSVIISTVTFKNFCTAFYKSSIHLILCPNWDASALHHFVLLILF